MEGYERGGYSLDLKHGEMNVDLRDKAGIIDPVAMISRGNGREKVTDNNSPWNKQFNEWTYAYQIKNLKVITETLSLPDLIAIWWLAGAPQKHSYLKQLSINASSWKEMR